MHLLFSISFPPHLQPAVYIFNWLGSSLCISDVCIELDYANIKQDKTGFFSLCSLFKISCVSHFYHMNLFFSHVLHDITWYTSIFHQCWACFDYLYIPYCIVQWLKKVLTSFCKYERICTIPKLLYIQKIMRKLGF